MDEEKNREKEISTGLSPADTKDYFVSSGSTESFSSEIPSKKKPGSSDGGNGFFAFALGFVSCLAVLFVFCYVFNLGRFLSGEQFKQYLEITEKYGKYEEIMKLIDEDPLAKKGADEISDESLKELVSSTGDPYAEYYTAEEYKEFEKKYLGDYVGVGIGVVEEDGNVVIMKILKDGPAEEAGLKPDDIIKAIDCKKPSDVDEAIDMISGEAGTDVTITIERDGKTLDVTLPRAHIEEDSVQYSKYLDENGKDTNIGYIYISSFRDNTFNDFKLAVKDLEGEGCDKFIIDLRDNGGGLTDASIDIADYLLPECRIMTEVSKKGKETVHNSDASSAGVDYVLLVNGHTASASEILTAAVQDNKGGTVIGEKTYGKGVTQLSKKFKDGSSIKITTTEYFRPNGGKVNGVGITPDIDAKGSEAIDKALEELEK